MAPKQKALSQRRKPLEEREAQIIRRMKKVLKLPVTKIALAVDRNKSSVYKALDKSFDPQTRGPKAHLSAKHVNLLVRTIKAMVKKAKARKEITLAMVKKRTKIKSSERCIREALKARNIKFRKMRSKPILSAQDVKDRFAFSKKHRLKPKSFWQKKVDFYWDLKNWQVYINAAGRAYAAQREVRGAYCAPIAGPGRGLRRCSEVDEIQHWREVRSHCWWRWQRPTASLA